MSLDFDGSDVVTLASQTLGNNLTVAAWVKANSQGEADRGTIAAHSTRFFLSWNN